MGVIQQNINQLIGIAGLASQLPFGQGIKDKVTSKRLSKAQSIAQQNRPYGKIGIDGPSQEIAKEQSDIAQRQFERNPTQSTYEDAVKSYNLSHKTQYLASQMQGYRDALTHQRTVGMEQANQHSQQIAQQQTRQKRKFMEYLGREDSSLGRIGDLPENLQRAIAKQYTPSMRKKLMDRMDKERKGMK